MSGPRLLSMALTSGLLAAPAWGAEAGAPLLTLRECLTLADQNNPEVQSARNALLARKASERTALAAFFPRVEYEGSYRSEGSLNVTTDVDSRTQTLSPASLSLTQLLFDFGRARLAWRRSRHEFTNSLWSLESTKGQVSLAVANAFISLLKAQRALGVAEETLQQRERLLQMTQELYRTGVKPLFDVTRTEMDLWNARLERVGQTTRNKLEWKNLATTLGVPDLPDRPLEDILSEEEILLDEERVVRAALLHRPEVLAQQAQLDGQREALAAARREMLPTTELSSSWAYRQARSDGAFGGHQRSWSVGATARLNLFSGGAQRAAIDREAANVEKGEQDLAALRLRVASETRDALITLAAEAEKVGISRKLQDLAEGNERLSWELYRSGKGNVIQVTDAQRELLSARLNRIGTLADFRAAIYKLERASGLPLEKLRALER